MLNCRSKTGLAFLYNTVFSPLSFVVFYCLLFALFILYSMSVRYGKTADNGSHMSLNSFPYLIYERRKVVKLFKKVGTMYVLQNNTVQPGANRFEAI